MTRVALLVNPPPARKPGDGPPRDPGSDPARDPEQMRG